MVRIRCIGLDDIQPDVGMVDQNGAVQLAMADLSDEIQPFKISDLPRTEFELCILDMLTCSVYHRRVQHQAHQPPRVGHAPDMSPRLEREEKQR